MDFSIATLKLEERLPLELRALYERYGYRKYRMSQFEEYGLYLENKRFLESEKLITFHDSAGRLLALKPDVTLSIVKNTRGSRKAAEKLYYIENVFRYAPATKEYKEIAQVGLELIGTVGTYEAAEAVTLAAKSLVAIDPDYVIDLSHIGILGELMGGLNAPEQVKKSLLKAIRQKNLHDLARLAEEGGIDRAFVDSVTALTAVQGDLAAAISAARKVCPAAKEALDELEAICAILEAEGLADKIRADFSIVNDIEYYDGVIFQGYVGKVPHVVAAGGCYGKLLQKFGKDTDAVGFAVYLDGLSRYYPTSAFSVDAVVVYEGDPAAALAFADRLRAQGKTVWMGSTPPVELRFKTMYRVGATGTEEVTNA